MAAPAPTLQRRWARIRRRTSYKASAESANSGTVDVENAKCRRSAGRPEHGTGDVYLLIVCTRSETRKRATDRTFRIPARCTSTSKIVRIKINEEEPIAHLARPSAPRRDRTCLIRHMKLRHSLVLSASSLWLITNNVIRTASWGIARSAPRPTQGATGLTALHSPSHLPSKLFCSFGPQKWLTACRIVCLTSPMRKRLSSPCAERRFASTCSLGIPRQPPQ